MATRWKDVWAQRRLDESLSSQLGQLMAADGFDSPSGEPTEEAWREHLAHVGWRLGVTQYSSIFEVGCGAGAFLYEWYRWGCRIGGLDAAPALVGIAKACMPSADLKLADAVELDTQDRYEFVVASGVFRYFESHEYARGVAERMAKKAERGVAILDVPDEATRSASLALRAARRPAGRPPLDHLYYERDWLRGVLDQAGLTQVETADQTIRGYAHAPHRFNVFAFRA